MDTISYNRQLLNIDQFLDDVVFLRGNALDPLLLPMLGQRIQKLKPDGVLDVIATSTELCIILDSSVKVNMRKLIDQCHEMVLKPSKHTIAVDFAKGEDLAWVSHQIGKTVSETVQAICKHVFTVGMFGFLPNFFYLTGLKNEFHLARRSNPRTRVPKGAFALGGPYVGIYPTSSPGGWHILGQCDEVYLTQLESRAFSIGDQINIIAQ